MSQSKAQLLDPQGDLTLPGLLIGVGATFSGNVSIAGTLTKQDVTNVDSVGLITARNGINITGGALDLGDGNITNVGEITLDKVKPDNGASWVANMGTDKNISFQGNIGEIGSVTGFQAINDAGNANTDFGIRATSIRLATDNAERLRIHTDGEVECKGGAAGQNALLVSANYAGGANVDIQTWQRIGGAVKAKMIYKDATTSMHFGSDTAHNFSLMTGGTDRLTINSSGAIGIAGANFGTAGQVIKSAGSGAAVAWGDATVGVSSAGTSIGNATTLNFIGAGNTFAINSGTVDISIAGGGGGGSGQFNTGLTNEFYGTASGIGSTVFTAPSTSGKKYILTSLLATNVASANTDVNIIGAFDFNGGERSYFGYNIPLPVGMAAELLKQPMVLNPSDKVLLRSTDIDRNGFDTIVEYYGTYEMQESVDLVGVGLGSATMSDTATKTLYTSSGAPSVLQSIRIANITDSGPKPISISITHGSDVIRLVENLIVPKYASVEILDNQKRISSGAIVKVTLDEGSSMGVQLSAKKISST